MNEQPALLSLTAHEARTAAAVFERLFPESGGEPGATDIGVVTYVDRALAGAYDDKLEVYRRGLAPDFDCGAHGFVGGATLGAENQFLPIQISRESLPPGTPCWGEGYKRHIQQWQHFGVVRIQPDALPYTMNYLDLDPHHRDRSGVGLPVIRVTYDLRANEQRLAHWMETRAEEILRAMGATTTWRGPRFTGVGSSHEMGGCRMGEDPSISVVDRDPAVHDTPGLYVFGGTTLPSCPGINPTLTLWALCYRAAERLVERLSDREER